MTTHHHRVFNISGGWTLRPNFKANGNWSDVHRSDGTVNTVWVTVQNAPPSGRNDLPTTNTPLVGYYYRLPAAIDVRGSSSFNTTPYAHLNAGTVVKIIDGPRDQEGATWWDLSEEEWGGGTGWFTTQIVSTFTTELQVTQSLQFEPPLEHYQKFNDTVYWYICCAKYRVIFCILC